MRVLLFLKPDLKKLIVFLVLIIPLIFWSFSLHPLPVQFDLLNMYLIQNYIIATPSLISACFLGGYDCGGWRVPTSVAYMIIYSVTILFWYLISCIAVSFWNKILRGFGKKSSQYEKKIVKYMMISIVLVALILPAIGSFFVIAEIKTRQSMNLEEVFRNTYPEGTNLQEVKIRNYFFFPVSYELSNDTVCLYDADENFKIGIMAFYRTEGDRYVSDMDKFHRNVIVAWPFVEERFYLQYQGEPSVIGKGYEKFKTIEREKFDEVFLLKNVGMNNYDFCYDAKKEDIIASEKINISK